MHLEKIFSEALGEFLAREFALVRKNAHEQALCGRLARYLEVAKDKAGLDKYYVDVEYDRHGDPRKTMFNTSTGKPENIVKSASVLIEEYRGGKLIHNGTAEFKRSPSDSIPFAKNESTPRKSQRRKS